MYVVTMHWRMALFGLCFGHFDDSGLRHVCFWHYGWIPWWPELQRRWIIKSVNSWVFNVNNSFTVLWRLFLYSDLFKFPRKSNFEFKFVFMTCYPKSLQFLQYNHFWHKRGMEFRPWKINWISSCPYLSWMQCVYEFYLFHHGPPLYTFS